LQDIRLSYPMSQWAKLVETENYGRTVHAASK